MLLYVRSEDEFSLHWEQSVWTLVGHLRKQQFCFVPVFAEYR